MTSPPGGLLFSQRFLHARRPSLLVLYATLFATCFFNCDLSLYLIFISALCIVRTHKRTKGLNEYVI